MAGFEGGGDAGYSSLASYDNFGSFIIAIVSLV